MWVSTEEGGREGEREVEGSEGKGGRERGRKEVEKLREKGKRKVRSKKYSFVPLNFRGVYCTRKV